jgi:hypothetical protein
MQKTKSSSNIHIGGNSKGFQNTHTQSNQHLFTQRGRAPTDLGIMD